MRATFLLAAFATLISGCTTPLAPSWHWEKGGGDYDADVRFCKQQTYSGTDGAVTNASVRRMHDCMEARGWRKVAN